MRSTGCCVRPCGSTPQRSAPRSTGRRHQRISEAADPLHFGTWGGLATKLLWFVFGLALTGVSVSGVAIYGLRLMRAERRPAGWGPAVAVSWRGMGVWRWPAVVLVLIGFLLIPTVFLQA